MTDSEYAKMAAGMAPASPVAKNCLWAFVTGGAICALGQGLLRAYEALEVPEAGTWVSITLIFISAFFTGLSLYDDLAKHAGAGTLVPITGFANAVVSAAMEYRTEGFITGVGAKMFTIAGPVIVYGTAASVVYGLIYWLTTIF